MALQMPSIALTWFECASRFVQLLSFRLRYKWHAAAGPLTRVDRRRKGAREAFVATGGNVEAGIGLPVCRSIVRAHGGDIRAEPRPSGGTVFIVSLPHAGA